MADITYDSIPGATIAHWELLVGSDHEIVSGHLPSHPPRVDEEGLEEEVLFAVEASSSLASREKLTVPARKEGCSAVEEFSSVLFSFTYKGEDLIRLVPPILPEKFKTSYEEYCGLLLRNARLAVGILDTHRRFLTPWGATVVKCGGLSILLRHFSRLYGTKSTSAHRVLFELRPMDDDEDVTILNVVSAGTKKKIFEARLCTESTLLGILVLAQLVLFHLVTPISGSRKRVVLKDLLEMEGY